MQNSVKQIVQAMSEKELQELLRNDYLRKLARYRLIDESFRKKYGMSHKVLLAYLFGSLAEKGSAEDVDLAVLCDEGGFTELHKEISECLGTERVDVVNLKIASPLLRFQVIKSGILIYRKNDEVETPFELATLREFRDTTYKRKRQSEILEARTKE